MISIYTFLLLFDAEFSITILILIFPISSLNPASRSHFLIVTNLLYSYPFCPQYLHGCIKLGSPREEFFANHLDCCFIPSSRSAGADFLVDGLSFEVGGKNKGVGQGADHRILDGLDTSANRIPLFLIGMLY